MAGTATHALPLLIDDIGIISISIIPLITPPGRYSCRPVCFALYDDCLQGSAIVERLSAKRRNACGNCYAGKAATVPKSAPPDAGHTVGDSYVGQAGAMKKSPIPNAGHACGDGYRAAYSLWGCYQGSFCLVVQYAAFACVAGIVPVYRYAGQAGATAKSLILNAGHAGGYGYAGKAGATTKSRPPDAGHVAGYAYAGKAGAKGKSLNPDAGHAGGYGYAGKAGARVKSLLPNAGHAVGYGNLDYILTPECLVPYCGNGHSFYARGNVYDLFCPHICGNRC